MSSPAFVVLPIAANGAQHPEQDTAGTHQDSLYKYISWEDPIRTLGSFVGAQSVLFGAHYLPLTQTALKGGVTILGAVSVTEFLSRQFGPNSLSTRLRPKEYRKVPEPTLNATLKDIHDLIQYAAVQAQRILFGQDLEKTFGAFLGFTALYWLIQIVQPFWLAVTGLALVYIAPLVASPRGRAVANEASARAQELANSAAENGKQAVQNGKAKAIELSSKAQQSAIDAHGRIQDIAQSGKQTTADLSARASDTASDISGAAAENVRKLPQVGTNAVNKASDTTNSTLGDAKHYLNNSLPATIDGNSDGNQSVSGGAANKVSQLSNNAAERARQVAPGNNTTQRSAYNDVENGVSSFPSQISGQETGSIPERSSTYAPAEDLSAAHVIINRPRGAALPELH